MSFIHHSSIFNLQFQDILSEGRANQSRPESKDLAFVARASAVVRWRSALALQTMRAGLHSSIIILHSSIFTPPYSSGMR
jgi:hypothetical protein